MKDYSQALKFYVCLVVFGLAWDLPPSSFLFLPLDLGEFALPPVPHCFLEAHNFFISQIHIWRAIYLRINYTLSLMHICFR